MAAITELCAVVQDDLSLRWLNPAALKQTILPHRGKTIVVTIRRRHKPRSDEQNRYYRGVVLPIIAEYCGYRGSDEVEGLHEVLKRQFLPKVGRLGIVRSTASLDTAEMTKYIDQIRDWAAIDLGLYIPDPNGN